MNRSLLQFVMRHADPDGSDAALLRQYLSIGDESAFAALVRRHGPMVWAVCRHLIPNRTDAEDAFQAVFLALAKSAGSIRKPEQLSSWLHGVSVRIAGKAKRGFVRRATHEHRTARSEGDSQVSELAWAKLLGAVHDEVAKLPPSLRSAFVLCELEGIDQPTAAERLGVKLSTLSGHLARARQMLLDRLTKRGVGAGLALVGTTVSVPPALADKATGLVGAVPTQVTTAITELAAEITAMKLTKLKLLAAGLMLTCGLTLSGLGLMPKAEGQPGPGAGGPPRGAGVPGGPGGPPAKGGPGGLGTGSPDGGGLGAMPGEGGPGGMMGGGDGGMGGMMGGPSSPRAAFEYLFVAKPGTLSDVAAVLRSKATQNWEYTGPLDVDPSDPKATRGIEGVTKDTRVVLVFKRSAPSAMPGMGGMAMGGGMSPGGGGMGGSGMGAPGGMMPGGPGGMAAPGGASMADLEKRFQDYDLNKDGQISREEAAQNQRLADRFEHYDTNRDGTITLSELKSGAAMLMSGGRGMGSNPLSMLGGLAPGGGAPAADKGNEVYQVYRLKNASASGAAKTISEVFNGVNANPGAARVRVVAEANSNSIIVTKASPNDLKTIEDLLKQAIDVKLVEPPKNPLQGGGTGSSDGEGGGPRGNQTNEYSLKYVSVREVAKTLKEVFKDRSDLSVDYDIRKNTLQIQAPDAIRKEVADLIKKLDVKPTGGR